MKTTCLESSPFVAPTSSSVEPLAVLAARSGWALDHAHARFVQASNQNLGHFERQAAAEVQSLLREATQRAAQAKADGTPPLCPVCGQKLSRLSPDHRRTFDTRFGSITVRRTRGYCKRCHKWRVPADVALGLGETAGYSPAVQEMAALLASKMPVAEASVVLEHLTGIQLPRATLLVLFNNAEETEVCDQPHFVPLNPGRSTNRRTEWPLIRLHLQSLPATRSMAAQ